jgi:hypothetical protein
LRRFQDEGGLVLGFALSPGLSIDYGSSSDRGDLARKLAQVTELGVGLICLALDDIPVREGLGEEQAALTTWLREELDDAVDLVLVPTEYTGTGGRTPYLDALGAGVPPEVPIGWTGATVVTDEITVADARARADALGGRAPLVWDNYPVNDTVMADSLFMGPLRGREVGLVDACSGWLANPMVQPLASKLPLASVAAFLRGDDPEAAWRDEADAAGLRTFAEACDGVAIRRLVAALRAAEGDAARMDGLQRVRDWLKAAEGCEAPGLEGEVASWLEQIHQEASAGLTAVRVLERIWPSHHRGDAPPDPEGAFERAMLLAVQWQLVRRGDKSVLGSRCSIRPVISQDEQGAWVFHRAALSTDRQAIDDLVELVFDRLATD